ncbi:MAG TPA: helix-turn-helix domain-containing protein [Solirubrobacteraceae bacterium]|jgi:cytoskeletal protein RodZ|nr:helix-turn-helix domain-containing protein [Solirubrobacteraceae bacterium]
MAEIGATLREARMRAKIDINEVETRTKIRAKYLRAIENEEWGLLPGDVYVKSFLRTYADYLGLDSRQLIDDYRRRYERPTDHEMRQIAPLGRERDRRERGGRLPRSPRSPRAPGPPRPPRESRGPVIPPWAVIGLVLVAIVVALFYVGNHKGSSTTSSSTPTQARSPSTTTTTKQRTPRRPRTAATTVKLQLVPTGAVYVCLVDGHGKRLIPGEIFNAGQTIPTKRSEKLMLTLGNASVKMKVNGVSVPVPSTGKPVGFELTPASHALLPAAKQPQCA